MEKLTEGTLLQVNATIIAGIFIFISLLSFNIFDLPFRFDENINSTDLNNPELSFTGNVVTIFFFLIGMMYPFIISSILILVTNRFDVARWWCVVGLVMILAMFSIILYSSIRSMIE